MAGRSRRPPNPHAYKVEFWSASSGQDRKHRARHYSSADGMQAAGQRWEQKGPGHWCRYWYGLNTWTSQSKRPQEKIA